MRDEAGRSKGWGIVEFGAPEEALAAIASLNGSELAGRKLLVREDREDRDVKAHHAGGGGAEGERRERPPRERRPRPPREERPEASSGLQVVVQGLPWAYTGDDLRPLFAEFGEVTGAEVVMGRDGRSRGYGTVRFADAAGAAAAIAGKHGTDLEGRTLTVKMDRYA
jgi:RNA recognition motif-containing protein